MKFILAICVPTYNRSKQISKLINSLEENLSKNCQIVICDDGSTDNTKNIINEYLKKELNISYKYIKHSGRPKALKESILMSDSEYIIISDDDDYFDARQLNSAIELIKSNDKKNINQLLLGGYNFLCKESNGKIIGNKFPTDYFKSKLVNLRYVEGIIGDKCEIYKSDIIKSNLYDLILNETRIPTTYIQAKIHKYDFICINKPLKIVNYLKGGMTNNILNYKLKSPNYTYLTYMELFKIKFNKVLYFKYIQLAINYWRFHLHASREHRVFLKKNIILNFFAFLFGFLFFISDKAYMNLSNDYRKN